jgi:hypothetical protein
MRLITGKMLHASFDYQAPFEDLHPDVQAHFEESAQRLNEQLELEKLKQLVLDYYAMCERLSVELYRNAGDNEQLDIALHELKKRAHALLPDETSLQQGK